MQSTGTKLYAYRDLDDELNDDSDTNSKSCLPEMLVLEEIRILQSSHSCFVASVSRLVSLHPSSAEGLRFEAWVCMNHEDFIRAKTSVSLLEHTDSMNMGALSENQTATKNKAGKHTTNYSKLEPANDRIGLKIGHGQGRPRTRRVLKGAHISNSSDGFDGVQNEWRSMQVQGNHLYHLVSPVRLRHWRSPDSISLRQTVHAPAGAKRRETLGKCKSRHLAFALGDDSFEHDGLAVIAPPCEKRTIFILRLSPLS